MADIYMKGAREYHLVTDSSAKFTKCGVPTHTAFESATKENGSWPTCLICSLGLAGDHPYVAKRKKNLS